MIISAVISLLLLLLYAPCCRGSWWSTTISSPKPLNLDDPKKCDSNKVSLEVQQHRFVAKEAQFIHLFLFIHFYVFVYPIFQPSRSFCTDPSGELWIPACITTTREARGWPALKRPAGYRQRSGQENSKRDTLIYAFRRKKLPCADLLQLDCL